MDNDGDNVDVVVNGEVSDDYVEAFVKSMLQMNQDTDEIGDATESSTITDDSVMGMFCYIICYSLCSN